MAWYDMLDPNFRLFLADLFGDDARWSPVPVATGSPRPGPKLGPPPQPPTRLRGPYFPLDSGPDSPNRVPIPAPTITPATGTPSPTPSPTQGEAAKRGTPKTVTTTTSTPGPTPSPTTTDSLAGTPADVAARLLQEARELRAKQPGADVNIAGVPGSQRVYEGRQKVRPTVVNADGKRVSYQSPDVTRNLSDVAMDPYRWDDQQLKKIAGLMADAGYRQAATGDRRYIAGVWQELAATSALMLSVGNKMSPLDLLKRQSYGLVGAERKSRTTTSTSTSYTVTSALTAEQLAHAALSQRLGRDATEAEVDEFRKELARAEKKDPTTTTTTTTTTPDGNQTSTSTTKQGLDSRDYALKWGEGHNKEEARAYQAAGQMMPWFFEALRAPV